MNTRRRLFALAPVLFALLVPSLGWGHSERTVEALPRQGPVPDENRPVPPENVIDVCQIPTDAACETDEIQLAVESILPGTDNWEIRVWPGFYTEPTAQSRPHLCTDDSVPDEDGKCPPNAPDTYSFQHHVDHPNSQNLIAVAGRKNVTIRGVTKDASGAIVDADRSQVVIDVGFTKHVGIRGDRADGLILENFSMYHAYDHGVYILDTDGFVIDNVYSGYSREYAFLTFANDFGLMKNCEAEGSGDGGLYPGGSADNPNNVSFPPGRWSTEIAFCKSHHNVLGYSGTQGDNVFVHDTEFYDNAVGLVTDSETDHPNYPQNNLVLTNNTFRDNNFNPYLSTSDVKATVFSGFYLIPVGTGILIASGNDNTLGDNRIYGNNRYGVWLTSGPGLVIGPTGPVSTGEPFAPPFTSNNNRFIDNIMFGPAGEANPVDFAWDGTGLNNCWQNNVRDSYGTPATSDAAFLPPCNVEGHRVPSAGVPNVVDFVDQAKFLYVDTDGDDEPDTPICDLTGTCGVEFSKEGAENPKNVPEDEGGAPVEPAHPTPCGPSSASC